MFIFDIFDVKRYNIPEPTGIKEEELDNFRKTVVLPVRLRYSPISLSLFPYVLPSLLPPLSFPYTLHRIYNLVKHWISRHWVDFDDNPEMITLLRQFIKRMKETDQVNNAVNLEKLLKKMVVLFSFFFVNWTSNSLYNRRRIRRRILCSCLTSSLPNPFLWSKAGTRCSPFFLPPLSLLYLFWYYVGKQIIFPCFKSIPKRSRDNSHLSSILSPSSSSPQYYSLSILSLSFLFDDKKIRFIQMHQIMGVLEPGMDQEGETQQSPW